jgi:hypothetical protein
VSHGECDDEFGEVVAEWREGEVVEVDAGRPAVRDEDVARVGVLVERGWSTGGLMEQL